MSPALTRFQHAEQALTNITHHPLAPATVDDLPVVVCWKCGHARQFYWETLLPCATCSTDRRFWEVQKPPEFKMRFTQTELPAVHVPPRALFYKEPFHHIPTLTSFWFWRLA